MAATNQTWSNSGYTAPVQSDNGMQEQSMAASDWLAAARFAYGIYNDRNPQKPKFEATPLSPEQKQIHEMYLQTLMNPATKDNASIVSGIAKQQLAGLSGMKWTSPHTFSGDVGYAGSNLGFTPTGLQPASATATGPTPPLRPNGAAWSINDIPNMTPDERLDKSRWANVEAKNIHFKQDSGLGGSGGDGMQAGSRFNDSAGQFANSWQSQLADNGALDPWADHPEHPWAGDKEASNDNASAGKPGDQTDDVDGSAPTSGTGGVFAHIDDAWDRFRAQHPYIAHLGQTAITTLFSTFAGLPGGLAAKYIFNRMNRDSMPQAQPSAPSGSSGFIPGSIAGAGGGA